MPVEMLTYADLADRLKISAEAARALAKRLRLPRSLSNEGKALVRVDFAEIQHKALPARSPGGHHAVTAPLNAKIESLQAEIVWLEAMAIGHRADFERERDQVEQLMAELLKATADTMAAKEAKARLEGELAALRSMASLALVILGLTKGKLATFGTNGNAPDAPARRRRITGQYAPSLAGAIRRPRRRVRNSGALATPSNRVCVCVCVCVRGVRRLPRSALTRNRPGCDRAGPSRLRCFVSRAHGSAVARAYLNCEKRPVPVAGLCSNVDEGFPHERADRQTNESGYRDQNSQMQNDGLEFSHFSPSLYPA